MSFLLILTIIAHVGSPADIQILKKMIFYSNGLFAIIKKRVINCRDLYANLLYRSNNKFDYFLRKDEKINRSSYLSKINIQFIVFIQWNQIHFCLKTNINKWKLPSSIRRHFNKFPTFASTSKRPEAIKFLQSGKKW